MESLSKDDLEKRPLMQLLNRLVLTNDKAVLTNIQMIEILKHEFNINTQTCHEVEAGIYTKVVKTFIRRWPHWEELERLSNNVSTGKDCDDVSKVLIQKYRNLKEYLRVMLDAAKPLAKKTVEDLKKDESSSPVAGPSKVKDIDSKDVVIQVYCTREQLSHLVNKSPGEDPNNAVFDTSKAIPACVSLNSLSFQSILNYWCMKISILLPHLVVKRELEYKYKHTLVNKVVELETDVEVLDTQLYQRCRKTKEYKISALFKNFDIILTRCPDKETQLVTVVLDVVKKDMEALEVLQVPASYKRNANKYKYVRYLYGDNEDNKDPRYDLQLEEVVVPSFHFFIAKFGKPPYKMPPLCEWLNIECTQCKVKFQGSTDMISLLQAHFDEYHQCGQDWQCQNCKMGFSVEYLAEKRWSHEC